MDLARKRGICIQFGAAGTYLSSTHVENGGRAVAAALSAPAGIYNASDDETLTKREYAEAIATAVGRKRAIRAPGQLAKILGGTTTSLTRSVRASNRRFKEVTG